MNHFSQQLNMSHISQCKPLVANELVAAVLAAIIAEAWAGLAPDGWNGRNTAIDVDGNWRHRGLRKPDQYGELCKYAGPSMARRRVQMTPTNTFR